MPKKRACFDRNTAGNWDGGKNNKSAIDASAGSWARIEKLGLHPIINFIHPKHLHLQKVMCVLALCLGQLVTVFGQGTLTAADVLERYVKVIGGKERLLTIRDMASSGSIGSGASKTSLTVQQNNQHQSLSKVANAGGTVLFLRRVDGEKVLENDKPVTGKAAEELIWTNRLFPELDYAASGVTSVLEGKETIAGKEAYRIKHSLPGGAGWYSFFDSDSGLKLRTTVGNTSTDVSDYRAVDGILVPFRFQYGAVTAVIDSVVFNKGLDASTLTIR